jgi:hypothetical protein
VVYPEALHPGRPAGKGAPGPGGLNL